jgi:TatD DNase family protein
LNEPANVVYIAQEIAKLKSMEIEDVARITTFNAKELFGIK